MNEIILALIILALLVYIVYLNHQNQQQLQQLLDRIMAKNLQELKEDTRPLPKPEKTELVPPEYADINSLSDDEWDKVIERQAGRESTTNKAIRSLKKKIARK